MDDEGCFQLADSVKNRKGRAVKLRGVRVYITAISPV
jgi:hypothetical protein